MRLTDAPVRSMRVTWGADPAPEVSVNGVVLTEAQVESLTAGHGVLLTADQWERIHGRDRHGGE